MSAWLSCNNGAYVKRYRIKNTRSGAIFGVYQGSDKREALDAYARDAGYRDYLHACDVADGAYVVADDISALDAAWDRTEQLAGIVD